MKNIVTILLLFISFVGATQIYTIRDIIIGESSNDTLCVKTGSPDSIWKKSGAIYTFYHKSHSRKYVPFSSLVGLPATIAEYGITDAVAKTDSGRSTSSYLTGGSGNKIKDSINVLLGLKLNYTDTAAMLLAYKNAMISAAAAILLKVNIADTANMLANYRAAMIATANAASATLTNKILNGSNNTFSNIPFSAITNYSGYTLAVQALTSSPTDAQTIYFGNLPKAPVTTQGTSRIYIRTAGTIKRAEIYCQSGTAGSNEAWVISIRLNNSGDTQIGSLSVSTSERVWSNTGLSIAVVAGDYIEIKSVNPTWGTNPLTTIFGGYIYIE